MSIQQKLPAFKDAPETASTKKEIELVAKDITSKYAVGTHFYPSDLGSIELRHYIEFAINVRGKSQYDQSKRTFEVKRSPDAANLSQEQVGEATSTAVGVAAGAIGIGVAGKIAGIVGLTGGAKTVAQGAGAAAGYAAGKKVVQSNDLLKPDTTYRLADVIALYVDGPPSVKYGMNYANKELGTLAGLLSGGIVESLGALNPAGEAGAAALTAFAKLPGMFSSVDAQAALSASSKTSLNPFKEVIFESVDFRTFNFKYRFFPKSEQESIKVYDIIKLFKFHMHPELSENKLFFIYPSEFQITYYYGNEKNRYFHRMAPCVLEAMDVTYGGEQFAGMKGGVPPEVNLSLTFRETEILTKDMINRGY